MSISGIYAIKCNGRVYVGRARNLATRWGTHLAALTKGAHHNKALQADFNKYGPLEFTFSILETCPLDELDEREHVHVRRLRKGTDYNVKVLRSVPLPKLPPQPRPTYQSAAEAYREHRIQLGLTQAELARIAGVTQPVISQREGGSQRVSQADLALLIWLKTLPRERLEALLADPSNLEGED